MFDSVLEAPVGLSPGESDDHLYELTVSEMQTGREPRDDLDWLDLVPPGPLLGAALSPIDLTALTGYDVVCVLKASQRQLNHYQGNVYDAMAETAHCVDESTTRRSTTPGEYAPEEIGTALTLTRRKANHDLGVALDLRHNLHDVGAMLESGVIDGRKAAILSSDTGHLEPDARSRVVSQLLADSAGLTTGQISRRIQKLAIEADPKSAEQRAAQSLSERKVVAEPNPEGTAALIISQCSPDAIYAARDHINMLARRLKTVDEPRSIDQLRADVALRLLTGQITVGGPRGGRVNINVDLTTLAELDDQPGDLAGYGPINAELARKIARAQTKGEWTGTVTDPETGEPLAVVSVRRRPSAKQRRMVRALHPTCTFKGCEMPAIDCDLDHIIDHAKGGKTIVCNHQPLCRRHHMAKHRAGWRPRRISRRGIEWTSPLGHIYRTGRPP